MMSFDSVVRLGWAFIRVQARRLRGRHRQLPRFEAQYAPDGILAFAPDDTAVLDGASRCYACGQCDVAAVTLEAFDALDSHGPMAFVLGVSRHSGHHDCAEIKPEATAELLEALTDACPVRVPFAPIAALVRRRHDALNSVRRGLVTR
ncbi:MAG: hypothetical protein WCJ30_14475 [Deltaproteobacteria bacterium]